jgi:hypothetical protein
LIEECSFGRIVVDGRAYDRDLLILPGGVRPDWWRSQGHSLCLGDLAEVLADPPEVLVIGQGQQGLMSVPPEVLEGLAQSGIEAVAAPTAEAVREYNRLSAKRRAAAALHLTC